MNSESGSTIIELVVSLTFIVTLTSALFLAFQAGNDGLTRSLRSMRTTSRALLCDDAYRASVRETNIAYWDKADTRVDELEAKLRNLPRSDRITCVRPIISAKGMLVGAEIRYELDGTEYETVETFGSWGAMEAR